MTADVVSVIVGPAEHGVTRHAMALADATGVRVARQERALDGDQLVELCRGARVCHWHFTDRLFGDDVSAAAQRFVELAGRLPTRHVVSLHDVPAGGRSARQSRRVSAYREVAGVADVVVVASDHECRRLRRAGIGAEVVVIPLPVSLTVADVAGPPGTTTTSPDIAVLGFVYPGKGHAEVLAATDGLSPEVGVVALGRASPGHGSLVTRLRRAAAVAGRRFGVTGFLPDPELAHAVVTVAVPVVAARAVSASASLGTWLAAGRRPIAVRNGFVDELDGQAPGLVTICDPDGLADAIRGALADPASTWRDRPVPEHLTETAVAHAHRRLYERGRP